jgi:hypothetical protein
VTDPTPAEASWRGPAWDDPALTELAVRLRDAHRLVAPLPATARRRLHRHLLTITDLAKRDPALAARRLETFLTDLESSGVAGVVTDGTDVTQYN